jgi:hypothetical protein
MRRNLALGGEQTEGKHLKNWTQIILLIGNRNSFLLLQQFKARFPTLDLLLDGPRLRR